MRVAIGEYGRRTAPRFAADELPCAGLVPLGLVVLSTVGLLALVGVASARRLRPFRFPGASSGSAPGLPASALRRFLRSLATKEYELLIRVHQHESLAEQGNSGIAQTLAKKGVFLVDEPPRIASAAVALALADELGDANGAVDRRASRQRARRWIGGALLLVFAALFVTQSQLVAAVLATLTAVGNLLGGLQRLGIGKKEEP
jgi:hypothetical protein